MGLCKLEDGGSCTAVKVVAALRRNEKHASLLYREVAARFEVKPAYEEEEEEAAAVPFVMPERGSEPVRLAAVAWKDAVRKVSGRGSAGN